MSSDTLVSLFMTIFAGLAMVGAATLLVLAAAATVAIFG